VRLHNEGCFIGQEVVSRHEHPRQRRTRVVPVTFEGPPASRRSGTSGGSKCGMMGSATAGTWLAALRIDPLSEAIGDQNESLQAASSCCCQPRWARFEFSAQPMPETLQHRMASSVYMARIPTRYSRLSRNRGVGPFSFLSHRVPPLFFTTPFFPPVRWVTELSSVCCSPLLQSVSPLLSLPSLSPSTPLPPAPF